MIPPHRLARTLTPIEPSVGPNSHERQITLMIADERARTDILRQRSFVKLRKPEFPLLLWRRGSGRGGPMSGNFFVIIGGVECGPCRILNTSETALNTHEHPRAPANAKK